MTQSTALWLIIKLTRTWDAILESGSYLASLLSTQTQQKLVQLTCRPVILKNNWTTFRFFAILDGIFFILFF